MTAPDGAVREAVRTRLDETMFVEAGAGSGKTTCLVERFIALVEAGIEADRIAAITFTAKAAGELADRIRSELQRRSATSIRCQAALPALDRAAICTLHAFAQRLLNEHPIEARLPPLVSVMDEIGSQLAFELRWEAFEDRIIEDAQLERPLRLLLAAGASTDHLHQVAVKFGENWDLVEERSGPTDRDVPPLELGDLLGAVDAVVAMGGQCRDATDRLLARLAELADWASQLRSAVDDDSRLERLGWAPSFAASRVGRANNWPDINLVRSLVADLEPVRDELRDRIQQACLERIAGELARFTVAAAEERRGAGELEFHDLLVLARAMLRDPVHGMEVRAAAANRYQRLLLDEFQDTDPIQVELAVLIASNDPDAGSKAWWEVESQPGRLFFVGDPKQSIYRFRRADIAVFLRARNTIGGGVERLTANFRTTEPILEWVNQTFAQLISEEGESQPEYVALDPMRGAAPSGPAVLFIGGSAHPRPWRANELREAEAAEVATAIRQAVDDGWAVGEETAGEMAGDWRPARWSDVAVLLPARTSLRALERALERDDIPYRVETSSLVYGTGEIRDLLMVARAVEDPTDSLAVVSALRTAAFGCGDDDLYRWRQTLGGGWDHQRPLPSSAPSGHIVAEGLLWLGDLHRERLWLSPSQILERIVRERRLMEVALLQDRPRDLWRRLRFVVDQCRAWEEAGGATLREYLSWVRLQSAEGARVVETVLPETDDEAIRILTVHGAKGLEFPIAVLSGMTTQLNRRRGGVQVLFPPGRGWALHLKKDLETLEFEQHQPIEEQMDHHERLRLLYVAATRARDHLIVSVHRKDGAPPGGTAAQLFYETSRDRGLVEEMPPAASDGDGDRRAAAVPAFSISGPELPSFEEWERERAAAMASASRPVAVSATRLAEEAAARAASARAAEGRTGAAAQAARAGRTGAAAQAVRTGRAAGAEEPEELTGASQARVIDAGRLEGLARASRGRRPGAPQAQVAGAGGPEELPGVHKDPRDIDLPPWLKGRYGSAIGRAVHGVLQNIDLVSGDGLAEACSAQAAAEGVLGREGVIERFCRSALASDVVREAALLPHWREVYVGIPYEAGVLEGYIDLLYRSAAGLVVVDYKTDSWQSEADLREKVDRYRVQLEAYGRAVTEAAGEGVKQLLLLFLSPHEGARAVMC
jgi:ATP-dependent exoDNAse (exonuclease V) beta subunit